MVRINCRDIFKGVAACTIGLITDGMKTVLPNCFGLSHYFFRHSAYEVGCRLFNKTIAVSSNCFDQLKSFATELSDSNYRICPQSVQQFSTNVSETCIRAVQHATEQVSPSNNDSSQSFFEGGYPRYTVLITALAVLDVSLEKCGLPTKYSALIGVTAAAMAGFYFDTCLISTPLCYVVYRGIRYCIIDRTERDTRVHLVDGERPLINV